MAKPSIPQGTRDFGAETIRKRNFILNNIRSVFELYGFQPLETPAMENLDTLMGKYGEEGDKLIFKILNNGLNDPKNVSKATAGFEKLMEGKNTPDLTERALKYDLTIPFARYVAMNHGQLTFPYKRYQVQPVWRADRPQKGRYREFTQCDADVVGSTALLNEVELCNIYHTAFVNMGLRDYELKINSRKMLAALAEICGGTEKMIDITVAIDKLDKIGIDKVKEELIERALTTQQVSIIDQYLSISGSNKEKITAAQQLFDGNETAAKGIEELMYVSGQAGNTNINIDFTLARGLNYYTGIIFEVKAPAAVKMGSIGGGGRYDDLTGLFGVPNIPGVGISFGVDRIYDVLEELNLFPESLQSGSKALFFNLGKEEGLFAFQQMQALRAAGISCEMYHETAKMDKQFKYAEKKHIPFVIIIGSQEIANGEAMLKELSTGKQQKVPLNTLIHEFQ
ncbi:MAG: histidine--tRNA ligase [Chitinophagaceae bacterium]|nr:MAG: histidine--tRNA ligase [Chitinophagaceae bacterium]